jgi:protein-S-isoprenylcysteine O-methyltransferase Ste14
MPWIRIDLGLWAVVVVVWAVAVPWSRKTIRREERGTRLAYFLPAVLAALLWHPLVLPDVLKVRLVPDEPWAGAASVAVTALGVAFILWARATLGRNWSGTVTVKEDHELITRGPYAIVRHPIYTGALLGIAGTMLAVGTLRGFLGILPLAFSFRMKSLIEERFMTDQFGGAYEAYKSRVKALVPFVW